MNQILTLDKPYAVKQINQSIESSFEFSLKRYFFFFSVVQNLTFTISLLLSL